MKKIKSIFLLFNIIFAMVSCTKKEVDQGQGSEGPLVFGFQPNEQKIDMTSIKTELESSTGMKVEFYISKDYNDLVSRFKDKKLHFAFFSPMNFVKAEKESSAKVLLKKVYGNDEFYYSALIALKKSKIKKIEELKNKKIAFVDEQSTSGYLYPTSFLIKAGIKESVTSIFKGTHSNAVQALLSGEVDAAAVWASAPSTQRGAWSDSPEQGKEFVVLQISEAIPNDAFVVREDYYQKNPMMVYKVMETMISMGERKILKPTLDVDGMATATSRHYDSVRELLKTLAVTGN